VGVPEKTQLVGETVNYKASLLIILCFTLASATALARPETVVKVGVYQNSPKIFTDENGTAEGIFIDVLENIAEEENWRLEYVPGSWQECLDRLESEEIDLMPDVAYSDIRAQRYDFSKKSVLNNWAVVYAQKDLKIESLLDLEGRKIAVMEGDISSNEFEETLNKFNVKYTLIETSDFHTIFELLNSDSVDAGLISRLYGIQYEKQYRAEKTPIICCPVNLHFATTKGKNQYLIDTIDRHLNKMVIDDQSIYFQSLDKWFGIRPAKKSIISGWMWIVLISFSWGFLVFVTLLLYQKSRIKTVTARIGQANVELYQNFRTLKILSRCNQELVRAQDELTLMEKICEIIVSTGGYKMAWVGYTEQDEKTIMHPVAHAGLEEGYLETLKTSLADVEMGQYPTRMSMQSGQPFVVHDILNDAAYAQWRSEAVKRDYKSFLAIPLKLDGRVFGALSIYSAKSNDFDSEESQLLTELANDLAYGLTALRRRIQQRDVEAALRESERKYRELVEGTLIGVYRSQPDGKILLANSSMAELLGYGSVDELMKNSAQKIFSNSDEHLKFVEALEENGQVVGFESVWRKADGHEINVLDNARCVRDANGTTLYYEGMVEDISERIQAETALRESERKYRELVENANSIILRWNGDGIVIYLNEYGQRFFGYTEAEICGRHIVGTIFPENGSGARDLATLMEQICANPTAFELNESESVRRNGEHVWIAWTNKVELDQNGQVVEILSMGFDITVRMRIEEELRESKAGLERRVIERTKELAQAKDRAEAADRTKSVFLATMSHELRTPLNSIIGFTGVILQGLAGPVNSEQQKQLEMVRDSSRHLLALINDILDISKIESGQLDMHEELFDLRALILKVTENAKPLVEKKGLALQVKLAPEIGTLVSDARRIEQVLINLLNNAMKFTERGTVALTAEITSNEHRTAHSMIKISVVDTGIGIKQEDLGKLFKPFQQIDDGLSRQHEGTGLGLTISQRLVQFLGGEIHVTSEWGVGSEFTFTLPFKDQGIS